MARVAVVNLVGLGIDSVDVARFAEVLDRRPQLAGRLFSAGEREYAARLSNPVPSLAARFAAKEAVMKALGVGLGAIEWDDVEVIRASSGAPTLSVSGRAAALGERLGVRTWLVSLTHTASVASAVVGAMS